MKQAIIGYVNHAQIRSCNQPVPSNEAKVSCSRKQRMSLVGPELKTVRHPPITCQMRYPLRHAVIMLCRCLAAILFLYLQSHTLTYYFDLDS